MNFTHQFVSSNTVRMPVITRDAPWLRLIIRVPQKRYFDPRGLPPLLWGQRLKVRCALHQPGIEPGPPTGAKYLLDTSSAEFHLLYHKNPKIARTSLQRHTPTIPTFAAPPLRRRSDGNLVEPSVYCHFLVALRREIWESSLMTMLPPIQGHIVAVPTTSFTTKLMNGNSFALLGIWLLTVMVSVHRNNK